MAETQLKDFPSIFSLKGKVVVVTGGSRGLGLHAASGFVPPFVVVLPPPIDISNPNLNILISNNHPQIPPSRRLQSLHHLPQSLRLRVRRRRPQRLA
jgi:hypothetical protein